MIDLDHHLRAWADDLCSRVPAFEPAQAARGVRRPLWMKIGIVSAMSAVILVAMSYPYSDCGESNLMIGDGLVHEITVELPSAMARSGAGFTLCVDSRCLSTTDAVPGIPVVRGTTLSFVPRDAIADDVTVRFIAKGAAHADATVTGRPNVHHRDCALTTRTIDLRFDVASGRLVNR